MNDLQLQTIDRFPEPAFSALAHDAFSDYEPSALLTQVLDQESAARSGAALEAV